MTTQPGFASRNTETTFRQFPQRDGEAVTDIAGMEAPGWSNSSSKADDAEPVTEPDPTPETDDEPTVKKTTARKAAQKKG